MDEQPQPPIFQQPQSQPPQRRSMWKWFVPALLLVVIISLAFSLTAIKSPNKDAATKESGDSAASTAFYDALGRAAAQQNIRVAQLRRTFASKADLEGNKDPGFIQSSVSEISQQKYRSLYAQKLYDKTEFNMERCMDGTTYVDGLSTGLDRVAPKTLAEANEYLKQMYKITENLQFITCPHVGVMPGATADLAPARMSDGLMPVTLSETQANNWKNKVKAANLFAIKDEGSVAFEGKTLHKYSFTPRGDALPVNQQLYDIFYETAEIDKIVREQPKAEWKYEFIGINNANQGGIKGYYLIDDAGLPAYSELQGINPDRSKAKSTDLANIGFNKQKYAYPQAPSLNLMSPLEILE